MHDINRSTTPWEIITFVPPDNLFQLFLRRRIIDKFMANAIHAINEIVEESSMLTS